MGLPRGEQRCVSGRDPLIGVFDHVEAIEWLKTSFADRYGVECPTALRSIAGFGEAIQAAHRGKWIENRSWVPLLPAGEPHWILIHASSTKCDPNDDLLRGVDCGELHYGAIIGYAKLIGWRRLPKCQTTKWNDKGINQHCDELRDIVEGYSGIRPDHGILHAENVPEIVHWIFVEPVRLEQPIPCAGKLRLWKLREINRGAAGLDGT
jgi:hypothetical protein